MSTCTFVRKNCSGYEFGVIVIEDQNTNKEKRHHHVIGKAPTYEEALLLNNMALRGKDRSKPSGLNLPPLALDR